MKEAMFYKKLNNSTVQCHLCSHHCIIANQKRGICGVRENNNGTLYSLVYGKSIAEHKDPIEKKPLFHFYPGSSSLSIATVGCNFRCLHCQNADISQMPQTRGMVMGKDLDPPSIVDMALKAECTSISYTYTEPTIYFEYAYETAKIAAQKGLKNVFVTNGYIAEEPLQKISDYLDAANIDLKAFTEGFYKRICGAKLQPVLEAIKLYRRLKIWIEITTLIIPSHNDDPDELKQIAGFIKEIGENIPWHVTSYYPTHRLTNQPRTSAELLLQAREIGIAEGLRYVYTGNIPGVSGENTYCYQCGEMLIERLGFGITKNRITNASCPKCHAKIDGIGMSMK